MNALVSQQRYGRDNNTCSEEAWLPFGPAKKDQQIQTSLVDHREPRFWKSWTAANSNSVAISLENQRISVAFVPLSLRTPCPRPGMAHEQCVSPRAAGISVD
jgi:hypothetical protein